ncbi:hypothetical protein [Reinekea sp. G2M2-21]|uniref:hypothetical protein n=1 Tax=Reinekea sp. G2M2-21 TaxID=2788942 RepID=UPI0018A89453|nr:hypothetical protein [Reinekea sp. G2M2-21]
MTIFARVGLAAIVLIFSIANANTLCSELGSDSLLCNTEPSSQYDIDNPLINSNTDSITSSVAASVDREPTVDEVVLYAVVQDQPLTVINADGTQVRINNSNQWESFANQQYIAGGDATYTVISSDGTEFEINAFDVMAYGEAARATRGQETIPAAQQQRDAQYTADLLLPPEEDRELTDRYWQDLFTYVGSYGDDGRPVSMEAEHVIAANSLAKQKIESLELDSKFNQSVSSNDQQQWLNNLNSSTATANGDVLTSPENYSALISALESGQSSAIDTALDQVLQDYVENSTYLQTFGNNAALVGEGLYLYPVALQQAVDEYEGDNGALSPAQIDAIREALTARFIEAGYDPTTATEMAVNTIGEMGLLYTEDLGALRELVVNSISGNYGLSAADVNTWFDSMTAEQWALLSNALLSGNIEQIRQQINAAALASNVDLVTIDKILRNNETAISVSDFTIGTADDLLGVPGVGTVSGIVGMAADSIAAGARGWLDFDMEFVPNWDDLMVQALYRSIGQPVAYVYKNLLQGVLPDADLADPANRSTPLVLVFQFGAAMGMLLLGALFLYTLVIGLYKTGKTGSFMGEDSAGAMYPIRSIYGMALMAPIPGAGGLTVATLMLIAFSLIGIALAGSLATAATTATLQAPIIMFDRKVDQSVGSNVLKSMVCLYTLKDQGRTLRSEGDPMDWTVQAQPRNLWADFGDDYNALLDVRPNVAVRAFQAVVSFFDFSSDAWTDPLDNQNLDQRQRYFDHMTDQYKGKVDGSSTMLQRIHFGSGGRCGEVVIAAGHYEGAADTIKEAYAKMVALEDDTNFGKPNLEALAKIVSNNSLQAYKIALENGATDEEQRKANELETVLLVDQVNDNEEPLPFIMSREAQKTEDQYQAEHEAWKRKIKHQFYQRHAEIYKQHFIDRNPDALDFWDIACLIVEGEDCYKEGGYSNPPNYVRNATPASAQDAAYRILESYYTDLEIALNLILTSNFDKSNEGFIDHMENMGFLSLGMAPWMLELRQKQYEKFFNFEVLEGYSGFRGERVISFGNDKRASIKFGGFNGDSDQEQFAMNLTSAEFAAGDPLTKRLRDDLQNMALGNSVNEGSKNFSQWLAVSIGGTFLNLIGDINDTNAMPISRLRTTGDAMQTAAATVRGIAAIWRSLPKGFQEGVGGQMAKKLPFNPFPVMSELAAATVEPILNFLPEFQLIAFLLSNIVPLLPTILFFLSVLGLLGYYFEAYFAVNLGVALKAHHEGDDLSGKGGKIYPLIMTVTMRAFLIVAGYWLGTVLHAVGFNVLNGIMIPAATAANSTAESLNFPNLTSWLGVILAWAALQVALAYKAYGMCIEFPNAAFRWMGVMDHQDLGEREGTGHVTAILNRGQGLMQPRATSPGKKPTGGTGGNDSPIKEQGGASDGGKGADG